MAVIARASPRGNGLGAIGTSGWADVLVITAGATPQVITETVFALAKREPARIPGRIICATTHAMLVRFADVLDDRLRELTRELGIEPKWGKVEVQYPLDEAGKPVEDIRTEADTTAFATFMADLIRRLTLDPQTRIHLSLAGGRKSMSYHAGAAIELFGRGQDELSHVLVQPDDFEGCADFWYPTRGSNPVRHRDGRMLDAKDARVAFSLIPFVRTGELMPDWFREEQLQYGDYVARVQAAQGTGLQIELDSGRREVVIGRLGRVEMSPVQFAFYRLLAEWARDGHRGAGPEGVGTHHRGWISRAMLMEPNHYKPNPIARFIEIYSDLPGARSRADGVPFADSLTPHPQNAKQERDNARFFESDLSRMFRKLQRALKVPSLYIKLGCPLSSSPKEKDRRWGLLLEPEQIAIRD
jgi:CRISPR-associated protein (TIGR02584 family)